MARPCDRGPFGHLIGREHGEPCFSENSLDIRKELLIGADDRFDLHLYVKHPHEPERTPCAADDLEGHAFRVYAQRNGAVDQRLCRKEIVEPHGAHLHHFEQPGVVRPIVQRAHAPAEPIMALSVVCSRDEKRRL
jgi:hypothetical protein